jgi:hypothetical protein
LLNGSPRRSPVEISRGIVYRGQGRALLRDDLTCRQYVDLLVEHEQYSDALRFLAHALPKRAAAWWGCLCLWQASRPAPEPLVQAVFQAAVTWVLQPSEEHRRATEAPARAAGLASPAGCLGMAVFWNGGSMGRADLPPIPPPPLLTARCVAGCVLLAGAQAGQAPIRQLRRREFIALGIEVANGQALWVERPMVSREDDAGAALLSLAGVATGQAV